MTLQTKNLVKKKAKLTQHKNYLPVLSETVVSNTSAFPMAPFKGTKRHLQKSKENGDTLKTGEKRKANLNDEMDLIKDKQLKFDPSRVMFKLEQFSDVWNDCPDIENPKSGFEIVPNRSNEVKNFTKDRSLKESGTSSKTKYTSEQSTSRKNEKAQRLSYKLNQEIVNQEEKISFDKNNKLEVIKNTIDKVKDNIYEEGLTTFGRYDSKLAEMKRKKAVQEQSQLHADQKNIVKKALSNMDSKQQINKKIVFSDAEEVEEHHKEEDVKKGDQTKTQKLFEDDDSSDADLELKINSQFEGKKGKKLLELQSKFASDTRFTLDSRFHDSESENEAGEEPVENLDTNEEKKRQLEILESIVKQPIRPLSESKKVLGKRYDESLMVRFDPTREDHEKYVIKPQKEEKEELVTKNLKKSKKENKSLPNHEESKPEVSKEKVYDVKDDLKEVLRKETKEGFSLLKLFGPKDEDSNQQQEGNEKVKKLKYAAKNPFKYDSSESESDEEVVAENKLKDKYVTKPALPSWRTSFFFTDNDSRLKEAEEFLKGPEEHGGDQEFAEKRKMLKDFIRHKVKNSNRKKDPFKKKLGGIKKKAFQKKKGK